MKPVKNLVFAALLVFSIAFNTAAGDIDMPGKQQPGPAPVASPTPVLTTDEPIPSDQQTTVETTDYPWYEVLTALLSVY